MKDLRRRFERFCLKNRGKGIPNLMLVIAIGNLAVFALSYIDPSNIVYSYLCFSRSAILRGQVWRLFSYIFTYLNDVRGAGLLLAAVSLFCYYQFGKILESYWGTFRFNLYYLTGLVLTDLATMLLGAGADGTDRDHRAGGEGTAVLLHPHQDEIHGVGLSRLHGAERVLVLAAGLVPLVLLAAARRAAFELLPLLRQRRQKHPARRTALPAAEELPHDHDKYPPEPQLGRLLPLQIRREALPA